MGWHVLTDCDPSRRFDVAFVVRSFLDAFSNSRVTCGDWYARRRKMLVDRNEVELKSGTANPSNERVLESLDAGAHLVGERVEVEVRGDLEPPIRVVIDQFAIHASRECGDDDPMLNEIADHIREQSRGDVRILWEDVSEA